jgi:LmbE family N-acetylglucosaminyl deacetylase
MTEKSAPESKKWLRILAVFAHPDDETYCAGGTLARYVAQGAEVMVVSATRGDAGQIRDAHLATRRTLGRVREQELLLACQRLGVQHSLCLDYGDGMLHEADQGELVARVVQIIRTFRPDVVITFGPDGAYGHPDHIVIGEATTKAFRMAGDPEQFPGQREGGVGPHLASRLYHSIFPHQRTLLFERIVTWLGESNLAEKTNIDLVHALLVFAEEATTLHYSSDHIDVQWFPRGFYIVEQGERATRLYVLLSGAAEVRREDADGSLTMEGALQAGQFFGDKELASGGAYPAHIVAVENSTCLIFAPAAPTAFAGRGAGAKYLGEQADGLEDPQHGGATTCINVSAYIQHKINALSAHRTQCPIEPDMFPADLMKEVFGREYFVRVYPPAELETSLFSAAELLHHRMTLSR